MRKLGLGLAALAAAMAIQAPAAPSTDTARPWLADPENAARYQALVASIRADMFRAGEKVAGWDRGGADPDSELRAGGGRLYYQIDKAGGVKEVVLLTDRPIAEIAPDHWRAVASYGSPSAPADNAIVQFAPLGEHHVMAMRGGSWRKKDVDCIRGITHAVLFAKPSAPPSPSEGPPPDFLFNLVLDAAAGQTICSRYEGTRETGWEVRHFLPDGRLVVEKHPSRMRIVPAAPLDTLISTGN